jgi:hypothetical protein
LFAVRQAVSHWLRAVSKKRFMKIDRHNYEEYFILYWDNELPEEQKQEVEKFVSENDDLQDEFRLLGETRFSPENDIQYEYKNFLLNTGDSSVNIANYKEQLLSYIDDELTPVQQKQIEEFISLYPAAQKELVLLQKVKLAPETEIVFPDKSVLYRREEKGPVIRLTWLRVAVAAAVIIVAGLVTFRLTTGNSNGTTEGFVSAKKSNEVKLNEDENTPGSNIISDNSKKVTDNTPDTKSLSESPVPAETDQLAVTDKSKDNYNIPGVKSMEEDEPVTAQTEIQQNTTEEIIFPEPIKITGETVAYNETEKKNNLFENTGVTERPTPSYSIYNESPKESGGLKEFFRKTTRMIERRTRSQNTDDNKLLVGVFAVAL